MTVDEFLALAKATAPIDAHSFAALSVFLAEGANAKASFLPDSVANTALPQVVITAGGFGLSLEKDQVASAGASSIPNDCPVSTQDLKAGADRLAFMQTMSSTRAGKSEFDKFTELLEDINAERSRYAFGLSAVIAAETARQNVREFIKRYS
jgi:hypothetical protein